MGSATPPVHGCSDMVIGGRVGVVVGGLGVGFVVYSIPVSHWVFIRL